MKVRSMIAGSIRAEEQKYVGGVSYHLYRRGTQTADGFDNHVMTIAVANDAVIDGWSASNLAGNLLGKGVGYVDLCKLMKVHGCLAAYIDPDK